jgi:hypothetical protein
MEKKRLFGLLIASFVIISLSASFVSAQGLGVIAEFIDDTVEGFTPLLEPALGVDTSVAGGGGTLFSKALMVILVILVIMAILEQINFFSGRKKSQFLVGLIIGILGVRFLPNNLVDGMLFPSTALIGAITIGIPFVVYFFVLEKLDNPMVRKVGWILFGALMFIMASYNDEVMNLYFVFIAVCAIAFWLDGTLHRWFSKSMVKMTLEAGVAERRSLIVDEIDELRRQFSASGLTDKQRKNLLRKISNKTKALEKLM